MTEKELKICALIPEGILYSTMSHGLIGGPYEHTNHMTGEKIVNDNPKPPQQWLIPQERKKTCLKQRCQYGYGLV